MVLPLKGKWIVVTRPKYQADYLRTQLEAEGANVILFPLLEITFPNDISSAQKQLSQIDKYTLVIFTSANAVTYSLKWLDRNQLKKLKIAAIGKKTAKLLEEQGIRVSFFPSQGFNSEALLAMPEIQSYGETAKIAILRGQNGRNYLKEGLQRQGAKVEYIDVYQRISPHSNLNFLEKKFRASQLDIIVITSGSSLANLFKHLPKNDWLRRVPLLLGSERIKTQLLKKYSHQGELLSTVDPSDEAIYEQLLAWGQSK